MRIQAPWLNSRANLWEVGGDDREWCSGIAVKDILWDGTARLVCERCGGANTDDDMKCRHCDGPVTAFRCQLSKAIVTLEGVLPFASRLLFLEDGASFEVLYSGCRSRRDEYFAEDVIAWLPNVKIVRREVPTLVCRCFDELEEVLVRLKIECAAAWRLSPK